MSLSEFDIIRQFFRTDALCFPRPGVELGVGDDAAVIKVPDGQSLVMSMDMLIADVHFPATAAAEHVASRALGVNLSDLAAMAAEPFCFTLGLGLPRADSEWLKGFAAGLAEMAQAYNCPLIGGDISRAPTLNIAIQVQGLCEPEALLRRDTAHAGDRLYVTGNLGDAAAGLLYLGYPSHCAVSLSALASSANASSENSPPGLYCIGRYHRPQPRLEFARRIARLANAAIDISDGIASDAGHLARESGLQARIDLAQLPMSRQLQQSFDDLGQARLLAACGGDDYELALTVPDKHCEEVERIAAAMDLPLTCIGEMAVAVSGGVVFTGDGAGEVKQALQGFNHFPTTGT